MAAWNGTALHGLVDISPTAFLANIGHQVGLFSTIVVLCLFVERAAARQTAIVRAVVLGSVFGVGAVVSMLDPLALGDGVVVDARSVTIGLAGLVGGPLAAATAVLFGCACRAWIGGVGAMPACISMVAIALGGTLIGRRARSFPKAIGLVELVQLTLVANGVSTLCLAWLPSELDVLRRLWFPLAVSNTVGILGIGLVFVEQRRNQSAQRELAAALDAQSQLAERHRIITNNVADAIVTLDEEGVIWSFNSSAEWIFGFVADDVVGRNIADLMPQSDGGMRDTVVHRYLRVGKARVIGSNGSVMARRRNGSIFPMELRIAEFRLNGSRLFTASVRDLTKGQAADEKRAKAEALLRNSEARFRGCAEASSDYLWESDAEHRFTSWDGGYQIAAFYHVSVIGRFRWEIANADPTEEPWAGHLKLVEKRQAFRNFVFSMTDDHGAVRWLRSSGRPFYDEQGRFSGYRGASSDITDAVEAQRALQARAQQQQSLAMLGRLALQETDEDRLSAATFDVLAKNLDVGTVALFETVEGTGELVLRAGIGWDSAEIGQARIPCSPSSLPGAAFFLQETVTEVDGVASHQNVVLETALVRSDLESRYGVMSGMAVGIGDLSRRCGSLLVGAPAGRRFLPEEASFLQSLAFILGAAIERRRAEASLLLRDRALEAIGQGLVISDATRPNAPAVYMNSVFERARGGAPAALLGRPLGALFASEDDPDVVARIARDLRDGGHFYGRMRIRHAPGRDIWEDVAITRLCDPRGVLTHLVAVQTDVTHRVNMEVELQQAQKMDAVGKLTGGVAHDFNNLLTVILGNAELLVEDLTDPQAKLNAEMVLDAAERGSDLVQRLLAFGRRQALQPDYIDLDTSIGQLVGLLQRAIGEEICLRTDFSGEGRKTYIDKSHLDTAVLNLVTNARDAMKGGGTLTIATRAVEIGAERDGPEIRPGHYLAIVVSDTGSGMAPEIRDRVFEPFFTTKELGKGTGLGLSTVYGFVQQSGGHVRIDTEVGRGTSVEILLPEALGSKEAAAEAAKREHHSGGERVLLVEDQDDVRTFVTAQLNSLGYEVVTASTAPAAIEILRGDTEVSLLFSDILLPAGLDGIELAERALVSRPDLRILFTSGYSDYAVERRSRLLERGVPLLKKPYRRLELATAVREALDRPSIH